MMPGYLWSLDCNISFSYIHSMDMAGPYAYMGTQHTLLHSMSKGPFKGAHLNNAQKDFNASMSRVRVAVEWPFGGITEYFAFVDFKKNMKLYLQAVGKLYLVSTILYNARGCLYGSTTSKFFDVEPPILEDYLGFI